MWKSQFSLHHFSGWLRAQPYCKRTYAEKWWEGSWCFKPIILQHSDAPCAWHLSVPEYLSLYAILYNSFKLPNISKEGIGNVFPLQTCWIDCYTHHCLVWVSVSQKISAWRSKYTWLLAELIDFTQCSKPFGRRIFILSKMKVLCHIMLLKFLIMIT